MRRNDVPAEPLCDLPIRVCVWCRGQAGPAGAGREGGAGAAAAGSAAQWRVAQEESAAAAPPQEHDDGAAPLPRPHSSLRHPMVSPLRAASPLVAPPFVPPGAEAARSAGGRFGGGFNPVRQPPRPSLPILPPPSSLARIISHSFSAARS